MKKCLPIRKLRCFVRVARLKKIREALKNHNEKNINFSWKFDPISSQKNESNQICYKNHSKHVNQGTLSVYGLIFGPFRDPKGIPKLLKMDEGLWQKSLEISPGASLGSFWEPDCSFAWFRLNFSFILGPSGLDFGSTLEQFFNFFNKHASEAARQQESKTATRKEENQTATQEPNIPTTKRFGSAECAKRL